MRSESVRVHLLQVAAVKACSSSSSSGSSIDHADEM
jgi:hypothetical protein